MKGRTAMKRTAAPEPTDGNAQVCRTIHYSEAFVGCTIGEFRYHAIFDLPADGHLDLAGIKPHRHGRRPTLYRNPVDVSITGQTKFLDARAKTNAHIVEWLVEHAPALMAAYEQRRAEEAARIETERDEYERAELARERLNAAAPDLLAACRALLRCPDIADVAPEDKDEETRAAERVARAAIARVEGATDVRGLLDVIGAQEEDTRAVLAEEDAAQ
jgi:hypothetical protein